MVSESKLDRKANLRPNLFGSPLDQPLQNVRTWPQPTSPCFSQGTTSSAFATPASLCGGVWSLKAKLLKGHETSPAATATSTS